MEIALKNQLLSIKKEDANDNVYCIKQQQIREIYGRYTNEEINSYEDLVFNGNI